MDFGEEEEEFEFEGLKPMLMKTINFNAQLCSSKAGAGEHYEKLKATCEKFQLLLCKASATEEQFEQKKHVKWELMICLLWKTNKMCVMCMHVFI